jgi:hypothetical protein
MTTRTYRDRVAQPLTMEPTCTSAGAIQKIIFSVL